MGIFEMKADPHRLALQLSQLPICPAQFYSRVVADYRLTLRESPARQDRAAVRGSNFNSDLPSSFSINV